MRRTTTLSGEGTAEIYSHVSLSPLICPVKSHVGLLCGEGYLSNIRTESRAWLQLRSQMDVFTLARSYYFGDAPADDSFTVIMLVSCCIPNHYHAELVVMYRKHVTKKYPYMLKSILNDADNSADSAAMPRQNTVIKRYSVRFFSSIFYRLRSDINNNVCVRVLCSCSQRVHDS